MITNILHRIILIGLTIVMTTSLYSQSKKSVNLRTVIDETIAIVGGEMILLSDIETQYQEYVASNIDMTKCDVLDDILLQKLLITQAKIDSVEVDDANVEMELDNRIRYYIMQFGSQDKFEEFYGKKISEIKAEFKDAVRDQLTIEQVKAGITMNVKVTPQEVKSFFAAIPKDEVPDIPMQFQYNQIVKTPKISANEMDEAYNKLADIRKRAMAGEDFATLAILYSEDKGSASRGGSIGTVSRGQTFPEFEAAAFMLDEGKISEIVKTEAGYHIIKLNKRKGEFIEVQHILISPKPSVNDIVKASDFLDSVAKVIRTDTMSFETAATKFSDDKTSINGGVVVNPYNGSTWFDASSISQYGQEYAESFIQLNKMKVGEVSKPVVIGANGKDTYRILYLKSRTVPHKANLRDDYNTIQMMALDAKKHNKLAQWAADKVDNTYIYIKDEYLSCDKLNKWIKKKQ